MNMDYTQLLLLFLAIGVIAFLYSSVGHAGASGYIATMTLFGIAPAIIRPTALVLNILVASIGTFQFWRAGHFSWKLFWPFALLSIPAAYLGGYLQLAASDLRILIGIVLLFSAARLIFRRRDPPRTFPPSRPLAVIAGAALGLLAGLAGDGTRYRRNESDFYEVGAIDLNRQGGSGEPPLPNVQLQFRRGFG